MTITSLTDKLYNIFCNSKDVERRASIIAKKGLYNFVYPYLDFSDLSVVKLRAVKAENLYASAAYMRRRYWRRGRLASGCGIIRLRCDREPTHKKT